MTNIIKAGTPCADDKAEYIMRVSVGKLLICASSISVVKHLTCYTQTWIVESAFGRQVFKDYQLASAYYQRLPNPQANK